MTCPDCHNLIPATGPVVTYRAGDGVHVAIAYHCRTCGTCYRIGGVGPADLTAFHTRTPLRAITRPAALPMLEAAA